VPGRDERLHVIFNSVYYLYPIIIKLQICLRGLYNLYTETSLTFDLTSDQELTRNSQKKKPFHGKKKGRNQQRRTPLQDGQKNICHVYRRNHDRVTTHSMNMTELTFTPCSMVHLSFKQIRMQKNRSLHRWDSSTVRPDWDWSPYLWPSWHLEVRKRACRWRRDTRGHLSSSTSRWGEGDDRCRQLIWLSVRHSCCSSVRKVILWMTYCDWNVSNIKPFF